MKTYEMLAVAVLLATTGQIKASAPISQLYAKLQAASENRLSSGTMRGTYREVNIPRQINEAKIRDEIQAIKDKEWSNFRTGEDPQLRQWMAEHNYSDVAAALEHPEVKQAIGRHIEQRVGALESELRDIGKRRESLSNVIYQLSSDRRVRSDQSFVAATADGQQDSNLAGRRQVTVLTPDRLAVYYPSNAAASVRKGSASDPMMEYEAVGRPALFEAGRSGATAIFRPDEIVATTNEQTPEGIALRVTFSRDHGAGIGNTFHVWYLPEKGHAVWRSEQYINGELLVVQEYGEYVEVEPGLWYPKLQRYVGLKASLDSAVREKLKSGELNLASEEVRSSQTHHESTLRERRLEEISIGEPPHAAFDLVFPEGTTVHDFVLTDGRGHPLVTDPSTLLSSGTAAIEDDSFMTPLQVEPAGTSDLSDAAVQEHASITTDRGQRLGRRGVLWLTASGGFALLLLILAIASVRRRRRSLPDNSLGVAHKAP